MRITVGPLPPAVYWRRRGVVLVGLLIVVLVMFYACSGDDKGSAGASATPSAGVTPTPRPTAGTAGPDPGATGLFPTAEGSGGSKPDASTAPTGPAYTLPTNGPAAPRSGLCADSEMQVTATAAATRVPAGQPVNFTIKFRNTGTRSCQRDIGANAQELRLLSGDTVIWSSDDCGARSGKDVRRFAPGDAVTFTMTWTGKRSRTGAGTRSCTAPAPSPATYQLVGRLDTALSTPVSLRLT